ncbi:hypothetical protein GF336_07015 [Candidatus Woesearchaeota archaeon]|nr:hypothetical protein [Candidatus Woesearchaeota archaeon]
MDKKAFYAGDTAPFYAIFGFVVVALFILFIYILGSFTVNTAEIPEGLEEYVLSKRFTSSCFNYHNGARTIPHTIDIRNFNQASLDSCYAVEEDSDQPAFSLTLEYKDKKETLNTKNWKGALEKRMPDIPVRVFYNNQLIEATLILDLQNA